MTARLSLKTCFAGAAALVLLALAPGAPARAGCGDYVAIAASAAGPHAGHLPVPVTPIPCHGPTCSGAPVAPPAPVPPPSRFEDWGWTSPSPRPPAPGGAAVLLDVNGPRPVRRARTIFRPPR